MLRYCVGHDSRAFGDHWVSGSLKEVMCAPLHVLVVILCSAYRAFSCSLLFSRLPTLISPFILYFLHSLIHYLATRFSTVLPVQCDRCWGGGGAWDRVFFWWAGLVAGLQVGRALRCSGCLGLGSVVPAPHVPGHPTSICDEGIHPSFFMNTRIRVW